MAGEGEPCFVIAEVSCNHRQDYEEAERIVRAAAEAGADAVKLQTYTADTLTLNSREKWFFLSGDDTPGTWKRKSLYDLYGEAYTPWEWQPKLKALAESLGLLFFSTPFDETAVDFLEEMNVSCYKIASYEATHIPLLKKVAKTGKPVIMSIGLANLPEVELSVKTLKESGCEELAVLHCITTYSDKPEAKNMNLATIRDIAERFDVVSGFSDNNMGIEYPIAAVAAGASIVEKHLLTEYGKGSFDDRFSLDPTDFKKMVEGIRKATSADIREGAMGEVHYGTVSQEEENYKYLRRSIFVSKDIKKGEVFSAENIRVIRPGAGMEPKYYEEVLGKSATRDIKFATPLSADLVSG